MMWSLIIILFALTRGDKNDCSKTNKWRCTKVSETGTAEHYRWACCKEPGKMNCFGYHNVEAGMRSELLYTSHDISVQKAKKMHYNKDWSGCKAKKLCTIHDKDRAFRGYTIAKCDSTTHGAEKKVKDILSWTGEVGFTGTGKVKSDGELGLFTLEVSDPGGSTLLDPSKGTKMQHIVRTYAPDPSKLTIPGHAREQYYDNYNNDAYYDEDAYDNQSNQSNQSVMPLFTLTVAITFFIFTLLCCLVGLCLGGAFGFAFGYYYHQKET
eukprot:291812_1